MEQKNTVNRWRVVLLLFVLTIIVFAFFTGKRYAESNQHVLTDTIIVVKIDTIKIDKPVYITEKAIDTLFLVINDTIRINDTLYHTLPITQRMYEKDSLYKAWVSGYIPQLDSLLVFPKTITKTVTNTVYKNSSKFGIGVTAGYGVSKTGFSPFVGIGVYYSIF